MTRTRTALLACACGLLAMPVPAQERLTENTFKLSPGAKPPAAKIAAMAWLAGHWTGDALGGISDEIWSPPRAGAMMGMYRLVQDNQPTFYELLTISEQDGSLLLRLKHFGGDLTGWEEKGKTVDFRLVAVDKDAVHFEGMSFHRKGNAAATVYLGIHGKDGSLREETFYYTRVAP